MNFFLQNVFKTELFYIYMHISIPANTDNFKTNLPDYYLPLQRLSTVSGGGSTFFHY